MSHDALGLAIVGFVRLLRGTRGCSVGWILLFVPLVRNKFDFSENLSDLRKKGAQSHLSDFINRFPTTSPPLRNFRRETPGHPESLIRSTQRHPLGEQTLDKSVPVTVRVGHVDVISDFGPGRHVHPIQARKALEELAQSRPARILSVGDDSVELEIDGLASIFECAAAPRLA